MRNAYLSALYDLAKDPNEKKSIISKKPEIARELKLKLQDIRNVEEIVTIKRRIDRLKEHGRT